MKHDPGAILCENCGYPIEGLAPDAANCPECGRPVAESMPERRVGSAWQRSNSLPSIVTTNWRTLRYPVARWEEVKVDWPSSVGITFANTGAVAMAWGLLWSLPFIFPDFSVDEVFASPPVFIGLALMHFVALLVLCLVESIGIRAFGRRRGWRTSGAVAWAVVGHASVGWYAGPLVLSMGVCLGLMSEPVRVGEFIVILLVIQFLVPLLLFETLVYLGWRRMRFANRPRVYAPAQPESAPPPAGAPTV